MIHGHKLIGSSFNKEEKQGSEQGHISKAENRK
jgi:hypothetical protein